MIVVVGQPSYRVTDKGPFVDGMPARIALAAAANGRSVQLVGKAGEDPIRRRWTPPISTSPSAI